MVERRTQELTSDDAPQIETFDAAPRDPSYADRHVHIVLLGLMGSGKSTVGRIVARELCRPFVDSDSIVELRSDLQPHEIADRDGLDELHRLEADAAEHVLATNHAVVYAAAASVVEWITADELDGVWSVWLETPPAVLAERVDGDGPRPGLGSSPHHVLSEQHCERFARARELVSVVVETNGRSPTEVAEIVCDHWRRFAARSGQPAVP